MTEATINNLTTKYNEMVLTAIDLGLKQFKVIKKFRDQKTGVKRCALLDAEIKKASGIISEKKKSRNKLPENGKITILVENNPKRGKAKDRFALYKNGMLVATYIEKIGNAKLAQACLRWDAKKKFISIT